LCWLKHQFVCFLFKFAIVAFPKLILFLISSLVWLSWVMRTINNFYLVTVLLSLPSKKMFTFFTVLISVVFGWFKLRLSLSLLILSHLSVQKCHRCFQLVQWYHLLVLWCLFFHVNFPITASISTPTSVFIMYSLYRLNRPGDKIQPCLMIFGFEIILLCLGEPALGFLVSYQHC